MQKIAAEGESISTAKYRNATLSSTIKVTRLSMPGAGSGAAKEQLRKT